VKNLTIYNTLKGRHETVDFEFTSDNTTWFGDSDACDIYRISDAFGGLLIQESGYSYPVLIGDITRADIANNEQRALELLRQQI